MLKNQRGFTTMWMILVMMAMLVFMVFVMESGRLLVYRTQLQTAADAGSLAGSLTGKAETDDDLNMADNNGDITIEESSTFKKLVLDKAEADDEAIKAMAMNGITPNDSQFISTVQNDAAAIKYKVELIDMPVGGVIEKLLGKKINQYVQSTSRVKAKPD